MTRVPGAPNLTPQFCFSSGALRDFLRLSRAAVDDSIAQHVNALVTPAKAGFDPQSTSRRDLTSSNHRVGADACQSFRDNVLFPAWQARTEVLNYCGLVATSTDPDDPETAIREAENQKDRERVIDERLDPYSARFSPREARTQSLAMLIRQERGVENIVRNRTWDVVQQRCSTSREKWERPFQEWREAHVALAECNTTQ
ncbi:hypothetical protein HIM_07279 [Hirsutella minnesotensis 3608]|uniref:Caffeine-induced death protein Cid2 n=1 Tax=Hirsutella minnesotensis 3608 TaxID=1043627 RepID=A0A0F7ZN78_9HYPO|nr:hypothetical protein HIM_07279 [Hirsutella minnesotensis 3608]